MSDRRRREARRRRAFGYDLSDSKRTVINSTMRRMKALLSFQKLSRWSQPQNETYMAYRDIRVRGREKSGRIRARES